MQFSPERQAGAVVEYSVMPLVIRKQQMAALQFEFDVRWYEGQLAELYPSFAAAPVAQRHQWINAGIQRAQAAGLNRSEWFQYLSFEQTFSPDCIEQPSFDWARRILAEPGMTSADRMKRLRHESIRRLLDIEAEQLAAEDQLAAVSATPETR